MKRIKLLNGTISLRIKSIPGNMTFVLATLAVLTFALKTRYRYVCSKTFVIVSFVLITRIIRTSVLAAFAIMTFVLLTLDIVSFVQTDLL